MTRYRCSVVPFSRESAALLRVSATPAMTNGIRGPRLATIRPAIGAHSAITTGIGKMVRPACSAVNPRTSCRYRVDRKRNPAIAAMAQIAVRASRTLALDDRVGERTEHHDDEELADRVGPAGPGRLGIRYEQGGQRDG